MAASVSDSFCILPLLRWLQICEATPSGSIDKHWLDQPHRKDKVQSLVTKYLDAKLSQG